MLYYTMLCYARLYWRARIPGNAGKGQESIGRTLL